VALVVLLVVAFWVSESAHRSPHSLPEFSMPCVAGWWRPGNVAIEIGDGAARAACLSVPKDAVVGGQGTRWVELDLAHLDGDCASSVRSSRVRIEQWQSAQVPLLPLGNRPQDSDFPDYQRFPSDTGASSTEMFVPRDAFSGLKTISCVISTDSCWAVARHDALLVKWPTQRSRLAAGLGEDWSCMRNALQAVRAD